MGLSLLGLELAYRLTLSSLEPLPALARPPTLPPKVAAALWAVEGGSRPRLIPQLFPWSALRYFGSDRGSLTFAWAVAQHVLVDARERGQLRGNLQWHLKGIAVIAWVTRNLSTDEILASYADLAWLGGPGRGLADGARRLFDKELAELEDAELALLVGLIQNPKRYDPHRYPERALARRNRVLEHFVSTGTLAPSALAAAQAAPLGVRRPL